MLTACASSQTEPATIAPDPVIEQRLEVRTVCPPEVTAALPGRPAAPEDAQLNGNESGLDWLSAILAYLGIIEARIADAKEACPQ